MMELNEEDGNRTPFEEYLDAVIDIRKESGEYEDDCVTLKPLIHTTITEQEVTEWCAMPATDATLSRLTDLLNGTYSITNAREDILSFRPSPKP